MAESSWATRIQRLTAADRLQVAGARYEEQYRGFTIIVEPRTPCPGIGWRVVLPATRNDLTSQGAFYETEDHPEGAYRWALEGARFALDQALSA